MSQIKRSYFFKTEEVISNSGTYSTFRYILGPTPSCPKTGWDLFHTVYISFWTYSTQQILHWDLFHTTNIALGPIPQFQYIICDLFHSLKIQFGTYSTVSKFSLRPIPQFDFFQKPGMELVPILSGKSPNHFRTISTLNWVLFHPKIVKGLIPPSTKSGTYSTISIGT